MDRCEYVAVSGRGLPAAITRCRRRSTSPTWSRSFAHAPVGCVVQCREPMGEPGDRETFAAACRVLDQIAMAGTMGARGAPQGPLSFGPSAGGARTGPSTTSASYSSIWPGRRWRKSTFTELATVGTMRAASLEMRPTGLSGARCRWGWSEGHNRARLDEPKSWHRRADHLGDVRRDEMGIVPLGHARV